MNLSPTETAFATALLGALIGGTFGLYKIYKAQKLEHKKDIQRDEKEVHNLLLAMQTEISTLWSFHMRKVGTLIEALPDGEVLNFYYPLTQDYFTIYHATAGQLGKVRDDKLRTAIVTCYNKCKKVVDGFKYYNDLFLDHRQLLNLADDSPKIRRQIDLRHNEMREYVKVIKEDHFELKGYVEELITLISHNKQ